MSPFRTSLPLHLAALLRPILPTARVLADPCPTSFLGQASRRPAAHAGLTIEDDLSVLARARKAETVFELLIGQEEAVG